MAKLSGAFSLVISHEAYNRLPGNPLEAIAAINAPLDPFNIRVTVLVPLSSERGVLLSGWHSSFYSSAEVHDLVLAAVEEAASSKGLTSFVDF